MRSLRAALTLAVVVAVALACFTRNAPRKVRYALLVERPAAEGANGNGVLRVGRVRVNRMFERKGLVYRVSDDGFEHDFYHEFFSPPGDLIRQATGTWLARGTVFESVIGAADSTRADWLLQGRVGELYSDARRSPPVAVLAIEYVLIDTNTPKLDVAFRKRYHRERAAADDSPAAFVAALNASLAEVLAELEEDLRAATAR
jgi:cholesterol transport system auxiliary component